LHYQESPEMSAHDLAEQTAGLASRLNNLALLSSGEESEKLVQLRDRLAKFAMIAIKSKVDEEKADYQSASNVLAHAIAEAGLALTLESDISAVASQTEHAIAAVSKVLA
jgi:hypothetical protein